VDQFVGTEEEKKARFLFRKSKDLRRDFGLTLQQYDAMFAAQNGVCAICGKPDERIHKATGMPMNLAVDHCHNSKKIRGLLCSYCNHGLGSFKDNVKNLRAAAEYLERYELAEVTYPPEWPDALFHHFGLTQKEST